MTSKEYKDPFDRLALQITQFENRVIAVAIESAQRHHHIFADDAKKFRRWTDRTGQARDKIYSKVVAKERARKNFAVELGNTARSPRKNYPYPWKLEKDIRFAQYTRSLNKLTPRFMRLIQQDLDRAVKGAK